MRRVYNKPVLEVESFVTEEIMDNNFTQDNVLSYGDNADGGYTSTAGFINFHTGDNNVLNGISYSEFNQ